jgi:hypothetical protein
MRHGKQTDPVYLLQLSVLDFFLNEAVATSYEIRQFRASGTL